MIRGGDLEFEMIERIRKGAVYELRDRNGWTGNYVLKKTKDENEIAAYAVAEKAGVSPPTLPCEKGLIMERLDITLSEFLSLCREMNVAKSIMDAVAVSFFNLLYKSLYEARLLHLDIRTHFNNVMMRWSSPYDSLLQEFASAKSKEHRENAITKWQNAEWKLARNPYKRFTLYFIDWKKCVQVKESNIPLILREHLFLVERISGSKSFADAFASISGLVTLHGSHP